MIKENTIESIVERYDSGKKSYENDLQDVMEKYPMITGFILQESNEVLTEEEKDLHWFITTIIIQAIESEGIQLALSDKKLQENEEQNWVIYEQTKAGSFYDKVSPLFEGYPQEDLLAFVEDMVQIDDENPDDNKITKIGREVIFMSAKSIIDLLD